MLLVNVKVPPQTSFGVQPKFRWGASGWRPPLRHRLGVWPSRHAKLPKSPRKITAGAWDVSRVKTWVASVSSWTKHNQRWPQSPSKNDALPGGGPCVRPGLATGGTLSQTVPACANLCADAERFDSSVKGSRAQVGALPFIERRVLLGCSWLNILKTPFYGFVWACLIDWHCVPVCVEGSFWLVWLHSAVKLLVGFGQLFAALWQWFGGQSVVFFVGWVAFCGVFSAVVRLFFITHTFRERSRFAWAFAGNPGLRVTESTAVMFVFSFAALIS